MGKFVLAVCLILCTGLLGVVIAQEQQPPPPPKQTQQKPEQKPDKSAEKAAMKAQAGEIVSIDATKNEVVIKDEAGNETRLLVTASTKITRDGKVITLAELKGGDKLTSDCEESNDGCKATSIKVVPTPPQN